jgi:hypothetical protein
LHADLERVFGQEKCVVHLPLKLAETRQIVQGLGCFWMILAQALLAGQQNALEECLSPLIVALLPVEKSQTMKGIRS